MDKRYYIESYCKIKDNSVFLNGKQLFKDNPNTDIKVFFKKIYKNLEMDYTKFFKMDNLSKLGILATEILAKDNGNFHNKTAIILSNKAASLDIDRKHQGTINNKDSYFPSPSVFVYTLPNICIGEISIKHHLKSENAFFVFNTFNANFHYTYEKMLLQNHNTGAVIGGWLNVDANSYEAFVYLASEKGKIEYTIENLNKLYTT